MLPAQFRDSSTYITTQAELDALIDRIHQHKIIAVDTEFTRQTTYYPVLSIIQIAIRTVGRKKEFFIIDALSKVDLSEFYEVMNDPQIIKIIHSASQDLQIFHHQSNLVPHGIMDTQLMTNMCGIGFNIGYSALVYKFLKKKIDKGQQNSDWQRRPLSKKQIEYALSDVSFLEEIYEKLFDQIAADKRQDWYAEEVQTFIKKSLFRSDDNLTRKIPLKGKSSLQIFQIKNLISWREKMARQLDIPRQHLLRDESIEKLVMSEKSQRHFPKKLRAQHVEEVAKILDEESFDAEVRHHHVMTAKEKKFYEQAKEIIQKIAAKENLETQFLISAPDLKRAICDRNFFNEKISGWRYQLFGQELEKLFFN